MRTTPMSPPRMQQVAKIMREQGANAVYFIGFHEELGAVEGEHGPRLGHVGWTFVFGGYFGTGVIVRTDTDYNVTDSKLMELMR